MSRQRDLLVNFERMWREMDELLGDPFAEQWGGRAQGALSGFSPRVDVYFCGAEVERSSASGVPESVNEARAIVKAELPGVDIETVGLEVSGRELVITGERPVQETEGRVYQQVEIEAGPFRRVVELGADVVAERARASYEDGVLRVELPVAGQVTRRVPIDPGE
jgi:HSP20 family protein